MQMIDTDEDIDTLWDIYSAYLACFFATSQAHVTGEDLSYLSDCFWEMTGAELHELDERNEII